MCTISGLRWRDAVQRALNAFARAGFARLARVRDLEKGFELGNGPEWPRGLLSARQQIARQDFLIGDATLQLSQ